MLWQDFIDKFSHSLQTEQIFTGETFELEHELTRHLVLYLRKLYSEYFNISPDDEILYYSVIYRKGDTEHDKRAWKKAKASKWIMCHGVRFVPDILIFYDDNVLPIEVKLIKESGSAQAVATAIGQAVIYNSVYPEALVFIGIKKSIEWGRYKLRSNIDKEDELFHEKLSEKNVRLIMREVD